MARGRQSAIICMSMLSLAGCTILPSLADVQLTSVRLATDDDKKIQLQADRDLTRQLFGGAWIRDPQKGLIAFSADDYDGYQRYSDEHPTFVGFGNFDARARAFKPLDWPVLHIEFSTDRRLIAPESTKTVYTADAVLYFCDSKEFSHSNTLTWHSSYLTGQLQRRIEAATQWPHEKQTYEFMTSYTYGTVVRVGPTVSSVTLMPPLSDLCLALSRPYSIPGKALRIDKRVVAGALGPLPRDLPINNKDEAAPP